MRKTLPKLFIEVTENQANAGDSKANGEQLVQLMSEMKGIWKEAANDLLQPRAEAIDQLLKKVLH